jgi:preprotein translocase subunit SecE
MKNPIKFIQEVKQEAFKVTWPTWKETLQLEKVEKQLELE